MLPAEHPDVNLVKRAHFGTVQLDEHLLRKRRARAASPRAAPDSGKPFRQDLGSPGFRIEIITI